MILYEPLWKTMEDKGITKYQLIHKHSIAKYTLVRLSRSMPTSTTTINDLCKILDCEISDIVKYVPDEKETSSP